MLVQRFPKDAHAQVSNLPNFLLEDGDQIYIPTKPTMVSLFGSIYQQNPIIFDTQYGVDDYIRFSGGLKKTADKSSIYRICADGTVHNLRGDNGVINPGDAIVVPEKINKSVQGFNVVKSLMEWTTILYQFGMGVVAMKALKTF